MNSTNGETAFIAVFAVVGAFSLLGIIYAVAIIVFNIKKKADRAIKLTSPNLNVIICCGAIVGLVSLFLLGLERPLLESLSTISTLKQASTFGISLSITVMFGTTLVKMWRVHTIFKKMNITHKVTRDEHLLLVVGLLMVLDIVLLTVWAKVDPLVCSIGHDSDTKVEGDSTFLQCSCQYLELWISLLFFYKVALVLSPIYYAWQTRQIKLPSLQDSMATVANTCTVLCTALAAFPALVSSGNSPSVRYAIQSISVLITIMSVLSWLFIPKMFLVRSNKKNAEDPVKFLFSESLKQKQGEEKKQSKFLCFSWSRDASMVDSILTQEIDTLKSLLKEKDITIRDLTNRLFFGPERFNDYLQEKSMNSLQRRTHLVAPDNSLCPTLERDRERTHSDAGTMNTLDRSKRRAARLQRIHAASPAPSSLTGSAPVEDHPSSASSSSCNQEIMDSLRANLSMKQEFHKSNDSLSRKPMLKHHLESRLSNSLLRPIQNQKADFHKSSESLSRPLVPSPLVTNKVLRESPRVMSTSNYVARKESIARMVPSNMADKGLIRSPTPTTDSAIGHSDQEDVCHSYSPYPIRGPMGQKRKTETLQEPSSLPHCSSPINCITDV